MGTQPEIKHHIEGLQMENDHLTREVAILKETTKELEMRIETQKQTLQARDERIKKLLEMLQSKGEGKEEEARVHQHMHVVAQRQLEDMRVEVQRKEQDLVQMQAKMKTVEEQHADYQKHIAVLKESLIAKEEHYNMLQLDVDELRGKLEDPLFHQSFSQSLVSLESIQAELLKPCFLLVQEHLHPLPRQLEAPSFQPLVVS